MIVVTGGSGKVGRACVKDLMDHGYKVTSIDMVPPPGQSNPPKPGDVTYSRADVTDFGQAMAALSMIDERVEKVTGVVHLAAIAAPGQAPNHVIFEVNTVSTYNVFEAARQLGIRNVVWASSETVYGIPYPERSGLRAGRRGDRAPRDRLLAVEADGREDGGAVLPLGPEDEDRRLALLQRPGAAGLRALRRLRQGPAVAEVQPLDLYRRARRGAGDPPVARGEAQGRPRLRHRQYQLRAPSARTTTCSTRSSPRPSGSGRSSRPSR